uniref:Trigger factor n=1 Tax=Lygus hesperus TaxID=30085 RepID=A0A0A9YEC7_LYGHE
MDGDAHRASSSKDRKNLFLLEVMIKKVEIDADVLLKSFTFDPDKIRVIDVAAKVGFSDFYSLHIDSCGYIERGLSHKKSMESVSTTTLDLEKAPLINSSFNKTDDETVPSIQGGKSCLFPMSTFQLVNEIQKSALYVELFTKDETAIFLGKTKLFLGTNFVDVVTSSTSCTDLPISAFMRSTLPMFSMFGDVSGLIEIYIRLSCFGKSILSDFSYMHTEREKSTQMKRRCCRGGKMCYL